MGKEALKPCPKCREAKTLPMRQSLTMFKAGKPSYFVACDVCWFYWHKFSTTKEEAISYWNLRAKGGKR